MTKRLFILIMLVLSCATVALAQDCYNFTRNQAISFYNKGEYRIAKDQFTAAKDCPDKPVDNDLDSWISKCNSAIAQAERRAEEELLRQQRAEEERLRQQRAEEERLRQQGASKGYMNIHKIDFGTSGKDDYAKNFYSTLNASDIRYLRPRIHYDGLCSENQKITLYVKIYGTDGTLKTGTVSPSGYTYSTNITVHSGNGRTQQISGWGTESGGSYTPGSYRIELWYSGNKIYSQSFTLQGSAEATYLTVDSKTAVSSTYSAEGGSEIYYVRTDGPSYEVTLLPSWCSVTDKTSSSFKIRWTANNTGSTRSDWFKVKSGSKEVRVNVSQASLGPSAEIEKVWVDHNQYRGGVKGMMIHVKFSTYKMLGKTGKCLAYFFFENGTALSDYNGSYRTIDGKVSVGESFTPRYESSIYEDFKLFMPNSELHMSNGTHSLKFFIQIQYGNTLLTTSEYVSFTLTN